MSSTENIKKFTDLPLSAPTLAGLTQWETVTDIQREAILPGLRGQDLLAAAKTGSGKTLAFLVPVVECLHSAQCTPLDGLVALIISPTRELAQQIFGVLEGLTTEHIFGCGLLIGGDKTTAAATPNILVATPGRLLQHIEETQFPTHSLRMLVLDEADRILDLGFSQALNAILACLPPRQTLLFSATQTRCVSDLARLSLSAPLYISVHELSQFCTPNSLRQNYVTCSIGDKLGLLWSFLAKHRQSKIIVFFSTCKQVKYVHALFRALRIGSLGCLHGGMKQPQRQKVVEEFDAGRQSTLLATDLAARGLDFRGVDWVVQFDCPDSVESYIHRVGRTARRDTGGHSLLFLLHEEEQSGFVARLRDQRIPIDESRVNLSVLDERCASKVQSCCAKSALLNDMCKKAIVSYAKWVFYASDKELFDVNKLDLGAYSLSMGVSLTPRLRFMAKNKAKEAKPETEMFPVKRGESVVAPEAGRVRVIPGKSVYDLSDAKRRMEEADISDTVRQVNRSRKKKSRKNMDGYLADKPLSEIEAMASQFL